MPVNASLRALSIAVTAALYWALPHAVFGRCFLSIGFAHYALAFLYSKHRIVKIFTRADTLMAAAALAAAGTMIIYFQVPDIVIYFGLHHALTESYLLLPKDTNVSSMKSLVAARFVFNLSGYAMILRDQSALSFLPLPAVLGVFAAAFLAVLCLLFKAKPFLSAAEFRDGLLFDGLGFVFPLAVLGLAVKISFWPVIFYHFIFWCFLPAVKMTETGPAMIPLARYGLVSAFAAVFFFLIAGRVSRHTLQDQIAFWGYIHITASAAISSLNPSWIRRLFLRTEAVRE